MNDLILQQEFSPQVFLFFLLCWSVIRKVPIWQSHDLDNMICTGDKICKDLGVSKYLNVDDLPVKMYLYGQSFHVVF